MWSVLAQCMNESQDYGGEKKELGEKIFHDFNRIFDSFDNVDSIEIIPVDVCCKNSSPIILSNHTLGVELWAVPYVYREAFTIWRKFLDNEFNEDIKLLQKAVRCILLVCAENATLWNLRKTWLCDGKLNNLATEFTLSRLSLQINPKSVETFAHRRWLIRMVLKKTQLQKFLNEGMKYSASKCFEFCSGKETLSLGETLEAEIPAWEKIEEIMRREHEICIYTCIKHKNNYNSWGHRQYTITVCVINTVKLCVMRLSDCSLCNHCIKTVLIKLWNYLLVQVSIQCQFLEKNVSDTSGWSFLQFLVTKCILIGFEIQPFFEHPIRNFIDAKINETLKELLNNNGKMISLYAEGIESLWNHRRELFLIYLNLGQIFHQDMSLLLTRETEFCNEILSKLKESLHKTLTQYNLCKRHLHYIEKVFTKYELK